MDLIPVLLVLVVIISFFSAFLVVVGTDSETRGKASLTGLLFVLSGIWTVLFLVPKSENILKYITIILAILGFLIIIFFIFLARKAGRSRIRKGLRLDIVSLFLLELTTILLVFGLPVFDIHYEWLAPLLFSSYYVLFYYTTLKHRVVSLSNGFLKVWSYVIMAFVSIFAYMVIFYIISQFVFHVDTTSEIIAMNLVMITIVVIIFPVWAELNLGINSLISTQRVNISFVVKKLNHMATQNINYTKLAEFLSDHMHFKYIGILINGKVYGTRKIYMTAENLAEITMLDTDGKNIWQKPTAKIKDFFDKEGIVAIAELRDAKGRPFAQMLIGHPEGKVGFEKRDLSEIEMIINIVASIIDSKERLRS